MSTMILQGELLSDDVQYDFGSVLQLCHVDAQELIALIEAGVLEPLDDSPAEWRFTGAALRRVRLAQRLTCDLEIELEAAALVLDLLDERDALRERVRALEQMMRSI